MVDSIPSLERDQLNQPWLYAIAAAISTITTTIVIDVLFVDLCSFTDIYQLHFARICWSDMRRCGAELTERAAARILNGRAGHASK